MRTIAVYSLVAGAACLLLTSCQLDAETIHRATAGVDAMLAAGSISQEQRDALIQVIQGMGNPWYQQLLSTAGAVVMAWAGVRIHRGPVATPIERVERKTAHLSAKQAKVSGRIGKSK